MGSVIGELTDSGAEMDMLSQLATEEGIEIAPGVHVRLRTLADYRQNPENPVAHTPRNLGAVIESIHKVGAARSGLAKDGKMLAGNLTSEAMAEAGIEGVIEVTTDGTRWVVVNRPDLSPEQEKQAAYGDQQGAFLAGWELDQVLADVNLGIDLTGIFTNFEIEGFVSDIDILEPEESEDYGTRSQPAKMIVVNISKFAGLVREDNLKDVPQRLIERFGNGDEAATSFLSWVVVMLDEG